MEEVKMVLDMPTLTALCEHEFADDEWQTWYGRSGDAPVYSSALSDHDDYNGFNSLSDERNEETRMIV